MKTRRKLDYCLNCYEELTLDDNYCPCCGQENLDQTVSLSVFLQDFFSSYLSFDSSVFRTIPAFLFRPGKVTITFNEGRRKYYLHPIRLYLIFSLFYFFVVSLVIDPTSFDTMMTRVSDFIVEDKDTPNNQDGLTAENTALADSILRSNPFTAQFSNTMVQTPADTSEVRKLKWKEIKSIAQDEDISDEYFSQAVQRSNANVSLGFSTKKQRKFIANSNLYISNAARNLPLMMFVLLPFFALLLKILYFKSSRYYIEHLIHSLHLHSFAYLIYGLGIILIHFNIGDPLTVIWVSFLLVTLYAFLSIKRIQRNSYLRTLFKFAVLGFLYLNILSLGLFLELYISLLLL